MGNPDLGLIGNLFAILWGPSRIGTGSSENASESVNPRAFPMSTRSNLFRISLWAVVAATLGSPMLRAQYVDYFSEGSAFYSQSTLNAPFETSLSFTPQGLNDVGTIVGAFNLNSTGTNHAFSYSNGIWTDLGTLYGASASSASAINNVGTVVGWSDTGVGTTQHAFGYSNGLMIDLGSLGGVGTDSLT